MSADDFRSSIVVLRDRRGWRDRARSYGVLIDGDLVARIKRGQRIELAIASGRHEVFMRVNWGTSRRIELNVLPNEAIELSCTTGSSQLGEGYIDLTRRAPDSCS